MPQFLTTREAGDLCGKPEWLIRRIVDALNPPVGRFGHKRMIPAERLPEIMVAVTARRQSPPRTEAAPDA